MTKVKCTSNCEGLYYAWVECDEAHDGSVFCRAMSSVLRWRNILTLLPKKTKSDKHRVDSAHTGIVIKRIWNTYLVLPRDNRQENEFIAKWIFSPGVKQVSSTEASLTIDKDVTAMADIIALGGHGGSGSASGLWGGEVNLKKMLEKHGGKTPKDTLKYVIIATCGSMDYGLGRMWLKAFKKNNPVRGILGYAGGYKTSIAPYVMLKFVKQLAAGKTVLQAWQAANKASKLTTWSCFIHDSAKSDTVKDWKKGTLPEIDKYKSVRYYDKDTYVAGGVVVSDKPHPYEAFFYMGKDRIDDSNNDKSDYGLFPGDKGYLSIVSNKGKFVAGDRISLVFYYWRPDKKGMDLNRLLSIDFKKTKLEPKHLNALVKSKDIDGFEYEFSGSEDKELKIPFRVKSDALGAFELVPGTNKYGFFWISLKHSKESRSFNLKFSGAHLYEPRAFLWFVNTDSNQEFGNKGKKDKTWTIPAGSRFCLDVYGLQKHSSVKMTILTKAGKELKIDDIMNVPMNIKMRTGSGVYWEVSKDGSSVTLKGKYDRLIGTMKSQQDLVSAGVMQETLFLRLEYRTGGGTKLLDVRNDYFKFTKPSPSTSGQSQPAAELYYTQPETLSEFSRIAGNTGPFKFPADAEVQVIFQNLRVYLEKYVTIYNEAGAKVAFSKFFATVKSNDGELSSNKMTMSLHPKTKDFTAKILSAERLEANGVIGKKFQFKLECFTQDGNKLFSFPNHSFQPSDSA